MSWTKSASYMIVVLAAAGGCTQSKLRAAVVDQTGAPVEGATICVPDAPDVACTTSNQSGEFTLILDNSTPQYFAISATASGYFPAVTLGQDGGPNGIAGVNLVLYDQATAAMELGAAGFDVSSATTGFLVVQGLSYGGTASISATSAVGPVYANDAGFPDPTLTSASSSFLVFFGNVPPGRVSVTGHSSPATDLLCQAIMYEGTAMDPKAQLAVGDWPATDDASVDAFIVAGAWTMSVSVECLPP